MIAFSFLVLFCTIGGSFFSLRTSRGDGIGIPLVAIGSFIFLYVIQALTVIRSGFAQLFLTDWEIAKAVLLPALMLAFFMLGWLRPGRIPREKQRSAWHLERLWIVGLVAALVGCCLDAVFLERSGGLYHSFSMPHGAGMAYKGSTAYVYDGPWLILSGSVMMLLSNSRFARSHWKRYVPFAFLLALLVNAILTGSRGSLFAVMGAYFVTTFLAHKKLVPLRRSVIFLFVVGCGVLVMVGYRGILHLGDSPRDTVPTPSKAVKGVVSTTHYEETRGTSGQEFMLHAVTISTVDQTGKLNYGFGWITYLVINPIPRLLWPEKHYPESLGINSEDIQENSDLTAAPGSATGIVADVYTNFGIFAALFFYFLGRFARRMFISAQRLESPLSAVGYVMFFTLSLNMFAQGFPAIFVPFAYSMLPVLLFAWSTRGNQSNPKSLYEQVASQRRPALNGERWSS